MKSTKKFLALALAIGVVSAPMIANAASSGPNEGARKFFWRRIYLCYCMEWLV